MIAIETKYIGPTNNKGARIKAIAGNGLSCTINYPYEFSFEKAHYRAVVELVKKHNLKWNVQNMVFGATKNGYVFCFPDSTINPNNW